MNDYEDGAVSELRRGLDVELGELLPGPAPFDAVVAQGRAIRRRRRRAWGAGVSAVTIVALASSLLVPGALRGGRPAAPALPAPMGDGRISVNSAAYDEAHGVMGSGTVNGKAWSMTSGPSPAAIQTSYLPGGSLRFHLAVGDKTADGDAEVLAPDGSNPLNAFFWFEADKAAAGTSTAVSLGTGAVAPSVGSIVAHYASGTSVSYPAVEYKGKRYIVIVSVGASAIDKLTAYGTDDTELGYEEPITQPAASAPETTQGTWYTPGQVPALAPATITFAGTLGDSPGTPWTIVVQTGGFGVCEYSIPGKDYGGVGCTPPRSALARSPLNFSYSQSDGNKPFVITVGLLDPTVTRVVATFAGGAQVQLPLKTIDGKGMCADILAPGKVLIGVTAYDASGKVFAHTDVHQPG